MARHHESEAVHGMTVSFTFADVHQAADCPDDYFDEATIRISGTGTPPAKDELKKLVDKALEKLDEVWKPKLKCGESFCPDATCTYDSALKGDLVVKQFTLTGHLHQVTRAKWTATQDVSAGCFCLQDA